MRPADSTNEEVIAAGKALIESGKTVTGFGLRQQLGGGGAQRLKQIWDEHQANNSPAAPLAAALPESLSAALDSAVKGMAQKFTELAHGIHAEATKAAEDRLAPLKADIQSKLETADLEISEAQRQSDQDKEEITRLTQALQLKADASAQLELHSQQMAIELAQVKERLEASKSDGLRSQEHCAELQSIIRQFEQDQKSDADKVNAQAIELEQLRQQKEQALHAQAVSNQSLKDAQESAASQHAQLKDQLSKLQASLEEATQMLAGKAGELVQLEKINAQLMAKFDTWFSRANETAAHKTKPNQTMKNTISKSQNS